MKRILATAVTMLVSMVTRANERHFTYTYESPVLAPGQAEIEPWSTVRHGRSDYYSRFDHRLEFEVGLVPNLQMAWYINFTGIARDVQEKGATIREAGFEYGGVSWESKYRLSDPVANVIGSALYVEASLAPAEAELEAKVILDKRWDAWLVATNLVFEYEWEYESAEETAREVVFEIDAATAYFLTPSLSLGLEVRNKNEHHVGEGFEHSMLFAGPTVAYAKAAWWLAMTVLPQVGAFKGKTDGNLDLAGGERLEARVLLGFHL